MKKREIKFRCWVKDGNSMVDWSTMKSCEEPTQCEHSFLEWFDEKNENIILMQFTGLKDVNEKEIYEGDVIEYSFDTIRLKAWITWNEYVGEWQYSYHGAMGGTPSDNLWQLIANTRFPKEVTVVGNIYENPLIISQK